MEHFDEGSRVHDYLSLLQQKEKLGNGRISPQDFISIFQKMGLTETEVQNFTLVHPIKTSPVDVEGNNGKIQSSVDVGANAFAVLRGKRAAGTESMIFNTPYFSKNGNGRRNLVGIATMLALAEYFQSMRLNLNPQQCECSKF